MFISLEAKGLYVWDSENKPSTMQNGFCQHKFLKAGLHIACKLPFSSEIYIWLKFPIFLPCTTISCTLIILLSLHAYLLDNIHLFSSTSKTLVQRNKVKVDCKMLNVALYSLLSTTAALIYLIHSNWHDLINVIFLIH